MIVQTYPFQQKWLEDKARFKVACWARQIGKTFTATLEIVMDCIISEQHGIAKRWVILSRGERQAREAMEAGVKRHLYALCTAFEVNSFIFPTHTAALEVVLPGGSRITALPANPDTARGFSAGVVLDEFAFHADSEAIWRALYPVISAGHPLRVVSTPNGRANRFYQLMTDPELAATWSRHRCDIYEAVRQGLPRDIEELRRGMADPLGWAAEYELEWLDETHAWLPLDLIESCMSDDAGDPDRYRKGLVYVGVDFAARGDLTVIAVLEDVAGVLWCRELIELRRMPFAAQLAELDRVIRDYRVVRAALDQTGLGEMPVQEAARRHGSRIEGVILTAPRKLDLATVLRTRFEAGRIRIPRRPEVRADLHAVTRSVGPTGAPRLGAERTDGGHADRFWALALACGAASGGQPDWQAWAAAAPAATAELFRLERTGRGWGSVRRADRGQA